MQTLGTLAITSLALIGCAKSDANIYGGMNGQQVVGNEAYVTVSNVWNEMDALPLADRHCRQFNKIARLKYAEGYKANFDCVTR